MKYGNLADGIEEGFSSFIAGLIWSALVPAVILCCPEVSRGVAILVVVTINAVWTYKDAVCMISVPIGTALGYLFATSVIASYDPISALWAALPAIASIVITILKITNSRSG